MAKTIEIQTAQQVVLSYDLASSGARVVSTLMDVFIQVLLLVGTYVFLPTEPVKKLLRLGLQGKLHGRLLPTKLKNKQPRLRL
jgi:hypothetical protein